MLRLGIFALLLVTPGIRADVRDCACDVAKPDSMAARECALCRETEKQPAGEPFFFLKDNNPRKPNRMLALPRTHGSTHYLASMTAAQRTAWWTAAIGKAKELWGAEWGVAINGDQARTQCHSHIHIGKLLQGVETSNLKIVDSPARIPVPEEGLGLWIHPDGNKLHVHLGEQVTETVLLR